MMNADLTLLTMRTTLPALSAARSWAQTLEDEFDRVGALPRLGCLLVGEGRPYGAREIRKVLGLPVVPTLPWAPEVAEVFSVGAKRPRTFDSCALVRSLRATCAAAQVVITSNRADLAATATATAGSLA